MAGQETTNTKDAAAVQGRFKSSLELLEHTLNCWNPECPLPHCVNMKLTMKHTQGCKKTQCQVCQRMKNLAIKHAESCDDVYCCIPFCMEEKLKEFVASQMADSNTLDKSQHWKRRVVTDDERNDLVTLNSSPSKNVRKMSAPHHIDSCSSVNSSDLKGGKTAVNRTASANEFSSPLRLRTYTYPTDQQKRGHPLVSPTSSAPFVKSSRLEQSRNHLGANETVTLTTTQLDASTGPLSASEEGPITTKIQKTFTPLLAEKVDVQEYTGTQQQGMSSLLPDRSFQSCQATQAANAEIRGGTDQLNTYPFSTNVDVSNCSAPMAQSVGDNPYGAMRGNQGSNGNAVLKARLMDALNKLLGLGLQRLETKEELVICIKSLRKAVEEIKALE